ncbi:MAG: hypothetical protein JWN86_4780 [Planctomycetota bacterium]|nr:hypothetical protein [Planctomycetota bacterium]
MIEEDLFELLDSVLSPLGARSEDGDESRDRPLDVLRYYVRPVRLSALPIVGRGLSVVAVCRQPIDVGMVGDGYRKLIERLARVVNTRFPPIRRGRGLTLGMTAVVTTPEPIGPEDDAILARILDPVSRARAVPLGVLRVNLGQEAVSFSLRRGPLGVFPEPEAVADALSARLRRFVPLLET